MLFPERICWTVRSDFLVRSYKKSRLPYIGDTVRLKSPSNNPRNVNKLRNGDLRGGVMIKIDRYISYNGYVYWVFCPLLLLEMSVYNVLENVLSLLLFLSHNPDKPIEINNDCTWTLVIGPQRVAYKTL